jgi:hypothetical protein
MFGLGYLAHGTQSITLCGLRRSQLQLTFHYCLVLYLPFLLFSYCFCMTHLGFYFSIASSARVGSTWMVINTIVFALSGLMFQLFVGLMYMGSDKLLAMGSSFDGGTDCWIAPAGETSCGDSCSAFRDRMLLRFRWLDQVEDEDSLQEVTLCMCCAETFCNKACFCAFLTVFCVVVLIGNIACQSKIYTRVSEQNVLWLWLCVCSLLSAYFFRTHALSTQA